MMSSTSIKIWFTRSNGNTGHNDPATSRYVSGEPPTLPDTAVNYRETCLQYGFARVGWPATGDLRQQDWLQRGRSSYSAAEFDDRHVTYLQHFVSIKTGDLVLIPADQGKYQVHLGRVVIRRKPEGQVGSIRPGATAYYYHHDIARGEWFENAHRVDVLWDQDAHGEFGVYLVSELGGLWPRAFGRVFQAEHDVRDLASSLGLAPPRGSGL